MDNFINSLHFLLINLTSLSVQYKIFSSNCVCFSITTVVNFEILAPGPQVSIIEGEDVTVTVGMNPVMTYSRTEVASLVTENGTALG